MAESFTVLCNQLSEVSQVVHNVDSSSPVKLGWLQQPEVVSTEVTERHCQLEDVLLENLWAAASFLINCQ